MKKNSLLKKIFSKKKEKVIKYPSDKDVEEATDVIIKKHKEDLKKLAKY